MTFDQAILSFHVAADAVQRDHPSLGEIIRGARQSASKIAERFRIDHDARRADRELAVLLLDVAEAAEREQAVQANMPHEGIGGPPSFQTIEAVRAENRGSLRGVGAPSTPIGAALGGALSATSQQVFRTSVRSTNRLVDWFFEVFGGPEIDVELPQPVGTVTINPFGYGDPVKAAMVVTGAFTLLAIVAWKIFQQCRPCQRRHCRERSSA